MTLTNQRYVGHLAADGDALLAAARRAPTAGVPSCPGWDMVELVLHVGGIHRWVTEIVTTAATSRPDRPVPDRDQISFDELADWYAAGLAGVLDALGSTDPALQVWNWRDRRPADADFWFRRMAQETVVHRWDAENAAGSAGAIDAELALDGIEEFSTFVAGMLARRPRPDMAGVFALAATDVGERRTVELTADAITLTGDAAPAATLTGSASDLYLWTVHRLAAVAPRLSVEGDAAVIIRWDEFPFG